MDRLLIIGLDGATFDVITPWAQEGKLPNLRKLLENGAHGALKSTIPPMSPPAWTSFMTGKNPGKHGVFDFTARKPYSYDIEFVNARWRRAETIWKIMSEEGKRICVLGVPFTYPPEAVNGVMISGIDTPATGGIADATAFHPKALYHEIAANLGGYLISPNLKAFAEHNGAFAKIRKVKVGVVAEGMTEIIGGLAEGEQVVVVGQMALRDGDQVRIGDEFKELKTQFAQERPQP
jgi:Type I phosphodiesterase / nucleotide pyrophosphatase